MRRSTLLMCALLVTATSGCDRVKKQVATIGTTIGPSVRTIGASLRQKVDLLRQRLLHKKPPPPPPTAEPTPAPVPPGGAPAAPSGFGKPAPATPPRRVAAAPAPPAPPQLPTSMNPPRLRDEPYVSDDTGTITPGMHEKDVYSVWGPPVAVRHLREFTYLFFKNGCEYTCGTLDVVTLQKGQVVDAIVRWPGHNYSGQSSSPASVEPHGPPPGGGNLKVRPDTT